VLDDNPQRGPFLAKWLTIQPLFEPGHEYTMTPLLGSGYCKRSLSAALAATRARWITLRFTFRAYTQRRLKLPK